MNGNWLDWKVARSERKCAVSGKVFATGDEYFSALHETGETFVRRDYSPEAWEKIDQNDVFSFWRAKAATPEKKDKGLTINPENVYGFFTDLESETAPERRLFRYLLALILTRKRILRLDQITKTADQEEILQMFDTRAQTAIIVPAPTCSPEQLSAAQIELTELLE